MRRYLVTMGGTPMSVEDWKKGETLWQRTLSDFGDIKDLRHYGNLTEGHIVCILEAPSVARIHELFESLGTHLKESGLFPETPERKEAFDIWPIELEYEGSTLVYQVEFARE